MFEALDEVLNRLGSMTDTEMESYLSTTDSDNKPQHSQQEDSRQTAEIISFEPLESQLERLLAELTLLKGDREHIAKQCQERKFSSRQRLDAITEYRQQWERAAGREPLAHRKDNAGRRAANLWLLEVRR